jgi:hypothetical protein
VFEVIPGALLKAYFANGRPIKVTDIDRGSAGRLTPVMLAT